MRTVRDGVRWHLIETAPGPLRLVELPADAARQPRQPGVQVDLGPLPLWLAGRSSTSGEPDFVDRFARFAGGGRSAGAGGDRPRRRFYCPINEISYWAWAGGTVASSTRLARGRGDELKRQLVRASIAAIEAVREVDPRARFVQIDPVINVVPAAGRPRRPRPSPGAVRGLGHARRLDLARARRQAGLLDIIGVNYYSDNQWYPGRPDHPARPSAVPPLPRAAGRTPRALRPADPASPRPVPRAAAAPPGCSMSREVRAALKRACRSRASASTRSSTIRAGTTSGTAPSACSPIPTREGRRDVHEPLAEELARQQAHPRGRTETGSTGG